MQKTAIYLISDGIGGAEQVVLHSLNAFRNKDFLYLIVNDEMYGFYRNVIPPIKIFNIGKIYYHLNPKLRGIRYFLNNRFYSIKPLLVRMKTKSVRAFLNKNGINQIHAHLEFALFSSLLLKDRNKDLTVIYTVHNSFAFLNNTSIKSQYGLKNKDFARVDKIVFVSRFNYEVFIEHKIPINDFKIIYNSINPVLLKSGNKKECNEIPFNILYVGGGKYVKGYDIVVDTAKLLTEQTEMNFHFTVLGDLPSKCDMVSRIHREGLINLFTFSGFINPPGQYKFFMEADILFMPSRSEAMPLAAIEALFFDIPVVASKVGGIPEVVEDGSNGFLCLPSADKFSEIIKKIHSNHQAIIKKTKEYNITARSRFLPESINRQLMSLYTESHLVN